jgi:hypothetical protein
MIVSYLKKQRGQRRQKKKLQAKAQVFIDMRSAAEAAVLDASKKSHRIRRALIAPTNSAGQGFAWARILSQAGLPADSLRVVSENEEYFDSTIKIPRLKLVKYQDRSEFATQLASEYSHFYWESLRPLFSLANQKGVVTARNAVDDIALLKKAKKKVAIILHGSDVRDVEHHKKMNSFSPFHDAGDALTVVTKRAYELRAELPRVAKLKVPIFVTTPDLFHEVPNARWLPLAIDCVELGKIAKQSPAFHHAGPPRVLFLPSNSWVKSANLITPILEKLDHEGVIEWVKSGRVPHEQIPELLSGVDVLIDQFIGIVGVLPLEAMAAGRLVLTHLAPWANEPLPELPPVIDISPTTLERELRNLRALSQQEIKVRIEGGIAYVNRWHDGVESKKALLTIEGKQGFLAKFLK